MPRYAVYETQKIRVIYFVEADNPDQAHDLVATMNWDDYDDVDLFISAKIDKEKTKTQTEHGWQLVEA